MKTRSADGTEISCDVLGAGAPLVLVHGTGDDAPVFDRVRDGLAGHFQIYVMHRRGRGKSGDNQAYEMAREVDDIVSVIDGIGGKVNLFGHSYGGSCSLEAARRTSHLRAMMIYEPPNIQVHDPRRTEIVDRLVAFIDQGERDAVVRLFLHEFVGLPGEVVARQQQRKAAWARRVAEAHTIPRELVEVSNYRFDPAGFTQLRVPARIMCGGATRAVMRETVKLVSEAIAGADMREFSGHKHHAMTTAPDLFTGELVEFFANHL